MSEQAKQEGKDGGIWESDRFRHATATDSEVAAAAAAKWNSVGYLNTSGGSRRKWPVAYLSGKNTSLFSAADDFVLNGVEELTKQKKNHIPLLAQLAETVNTRGPTIQEGGGGKSVHDHDRHLHWNPHSLAARAAIRTL